MEPIIDWTELAASRVSEKLYIFCWEDLNWKEKFKLKSNVTFSCIILRNLNQSLLWKIHWSFLR